MCSEGPINASMDLEKLRADEADYKKYMGSPGAKEVLKQFLLRSPTEYIMDKDKSWDFRDYLVHQGISPAANPLAFKMLR